MMKIVPTIKYIALILLFAFVSCSDDETIINELKKILKLSKYDKVLTNKYIKKKIAQNLDVVYEKIKDNKNLSNENIKSIMPLIDKEYEETVNFCAKLKDNSQKDSINSIDVSTD